jgi:ATP-dependent Zn protease
VPFPALYGADEELRRQDVISRRRHWYWKTKYRRATWLFLLATIVFVIAMAAAGEWNLGAGWDQMGQWGRAIAPMVALYGMLGLLLCFVSLLILFGPLLFFSIQQIKGYEPGDADWSVELDDVRGQTEANEEIRRIVSLWQSGEQRERGVLFLGPPGTGKTMLSKAIATSFNCPFVTIPGSGFQQTFMGMDALLVRYMARKAKKLAAKWGGQCIVFIDEIDAVGMRRASLGSGFQPYERSTIHDHLFFGERGALTWDGDLVLETKDWRDRLFELRAEPKRGFLPPALERVYNIIPGAMGGSQALNQLLVVMDGIDEPPLRKQFLTKKFNTFLDAMYIVPQKLFGKRIRIKPPKPREEQIYFIGACNVPLESLDPALVRPGRMGRHIFFRTPTWEDRRDVFDLYIKKVAHEPALDTPKARDELARITSGYSPAMIDQVCSLALTYAHSDGRPVFGRQDILEAMTTVEAGVAVGQSYAPHESRSIAIHEAGHAVCGHLYMENGMSTRLSIRRRGSSGGHHQMASVVDRFVAWRSEEIGNLIWTLGSYGAELTFYGQNTTGVGGDLHSVTMHAAHMVSFSGMSPAPIDLSDRIADRDERDKEQQRVNERFQRIGNQLMHRSPSGYESTFGDRVKREQVAGLLGQCFVIAWNTIRVNQAAVETVADRLVEADELYGDDVVDLLNGVRLRKPEIDVLDENAWPVI